jgi:hypothetical protein
MSERGVINSVFQPLETLGGSTSTLFVIFISQTFTELKSSHQVGAKYESSSLFPFILDNHNPFIHLSQRVSRKLSYCKPSYHTYTSKYVLENTNVFPAIPQDSEKASPGYLAGWQGMPNLIGIIQKKFCELKLLPERRAREINLSLSDNFIFSEEKKILGRVLILLGESFSSKVKEDSQVQSSNFGGGGG